MPTHSQIERMIAARTGLRPGPEYPLIGHGGEAEGGCGVIGIACSEPIAGRHLLQALDQMRNRGNGKGGGIAAVGLDPAQLGVTQDVLDRDYLLTIAYLDPQARAQVERDHIHPTFEIDHLRHVPHMEDHSSLPGLEVRPPEVVQYFVQPRAEVVKAFAQEHGLEDLPARKIEDELVYQNSYRLNTAYYAAAGDSQAFVLSHGKNLLVLKMVGYGDDVVRYYQLEDLRANVWIGHHRYPTKGRVWHPGGAHPFVGLNEALVHNGDFANYASMCEYLAQRNIYPLFLTDTEVSVLVYDLLHRVYGYPLEYVIEALAPTTERDYAMLPPDRQQVYGLIQSTHMHGSPDGPWFFLIAESGESEPAGDPHYRLTGITDTSMLRPQVFALQQAGAEGPAIGFAASEKQAIDAALESLAAEDGRFWTRADRYWNARGGSHTDGGAFIFTVTSNGHQPSRLVCTDKFGRPVSSEGLKQPYFLPNGRQPVRRESSRPHLPDHLDTAEQVFNDTLKHLVVWDYPDILAFLGDLEATARDDAGRARAFGAITLLMDRRYPTGKLRRSSLLALYDRCLAGLVDRVRAAPSPGFVFTASDGPRLETADPEQTVVIDARGFPPEGRDSLALEIHRLYRLGFRRFLIAHTRGQRFIANGLGRESHDLRLDVFGSPGDYLASGIDGAEIYVHASAQDQLAQIMKAGKLVVYGDVGQTFMYAAKGGEAYVLGNAAGRPLINAVGRPRVVINGTCLDYLAESFMAGDPHNGGGFVVLNGLAFDEDGRIHSLDTPYPGGNLFSLASGGAIYVRDPFSQVTSDQLNGGEFFPLEARDWQLIAPYLEENARLFGIPVERLLTVGGRRLEPHEVYRKVGPRALKALQAEEAWVRKE